VPGAFNLLPIRDLAAFTTHGDFPCAADCMAWITSLMGLELENVLPFPSDHIRQGHPSITRRMIISRYMDRIPAISIPAPILKRDMARHSRNLKLRRRLSPYFSHPALSLPIIGYKERSRHPQPSLAGSSVIRKVGLPCFGLYAKQADET
jgi:hypothetical protein